MCLHRFKDFKLLCGNSCPLKSPQSVILHSLPSMCVWADKWAFVVCFSRLHCDHSISSSPHPGWLQPHTQTAVTQFFTSAMRVLPVWAKQNKRVQHFCFGLSLIQPRKRLHLRAQRALMRTARRMRQIMRLLANGQHWTGRHGWCPSISDRYIAYKQYE